MNNSNIVKIGTALKWRSTFDLKKRYYNENLTTACGCVFRCKVLMTEGVPPLRVIDEVGHIEYVNPEIWDVVVDMAFYYNFVIDCEEDTGNMGEALEQQRVEIEKNRLQIQKLGQSLQDTNERIDLAETRHEGDIARIDEYHREHEKLHDELNKNIENIVDRLEEAEAVNKEQQEQLDKLVGRATVYSEGVWQNDLLWLNDLYWNNGSAGSIDVEMCEQRLAALEKALSDVIIKNNEQQTIIDKQQQQIEELLGMVVSNAIESYDELTQTIYFADYVSALDYDDMSKTLAFNKSLKVTGYDEVGGSVFIK